MNSYTRSFKFIIASAGLVLTLALGGIISAQTSTSDSVAAREAALQAELQQVLNEIADQQKILAAEQQKGTSLERDIAILNAKISEAKLKIRARQLAIESLGKDISVKTKTILTLSEKIELNRESLAQLIRKTNEVDAFSVTDVVLSSETLSNFFADIDALDSIKQSIQVTLGVIRENKTTTEDAKKTLDRKRLEEIDAKISIEAEKAKIESSEKEKARLLSLSKAEQKNYQGEINKRQTRAAAIRSALFSLRDSAAIPFGEALDYAIAASKTTGVRPAFLLAILTQESNLGANVGSCYLSDPATGDGVKVSTGAYVSGVMKPSRDVKPFMRITAAVGRNPMQTRVSCPWGSGYGGAMGPSQFIPSTWELFQTRIAAAVSKTVPDPWDPKDAFTAAAIYLSDLGADAGTYSAERNAACRYYSGRACDGKTPANSFYGDQVTAKARSIQTNMIDPLAGI